MRNLKFIVGFTLTGFVLSLFCGFFSHSGFLHVFLQAILFAVIFALLAFIISVLFDRFLNDGNVAGSVDADIAGDSGVHDTQSSIPRKGSKVDFVIQDEDLPVSESENQFFVGENHQLLNESDVKRSIGFENRQNSVAENGGFVPLQKESFDNLTETEAKFVQDYNSAGSSGFTSLPSSENSAGKVSDNTETRNDGNAVAGAVISSPMANNTKSEDVDTLPDMNEISFKSNDDEEESEIETPFASGNSSRMSESVSDGVDVKDASLMAKAISSILSGES